MKSSHTDNGAGAGTTGSTTATPHQTGTTEDDVSGERQPTTDGDESRRDRGLPKDVVFGLLSARRRRDVLTYLAHNGPETTLSDLAERIAARENDTTVRLISSKQRKRVYVALYQCHLPKLDDADVVDFENSRGTVELRPPASQLYHYMDIEPGGQTNADTSAGNHIIGGLKSVRSKLNELRDN
jgi:hypothetical protein